MTSIEKCLQHWVSVEQSRKEEIKEIIKELDEICKQSIFNYSMFEIRINDLRRIRVEIEHMNYFITSMESYKRLDNTWNELDEDIPPTTKYFKK